MFHSSLKKKTKKTNTATEKAAWQYERYGLIHLIVNSDVVNGKFIDSQPYFGSLCN